MSEKIIKPELLGGFRDVLPKEAIAQDYFFKKIAATYESFGFVVLDTPSMEKMDVLTGGEEDFSKSLFVARIVRGAEDKGAAGEDLGEGENFGLRFDLTVPLARVFSAYPELPRPFKRYQIGKVFRGERSQKGRFREFYQCDFDIVGTDSLLADVETIQVMEAVMVNLGLSKFEVRFNTRKILNGLAEVVGCKDSAKEVFRIIDKLDKIGVEGVLKELQRQPENEDDKSALALNSEQALKVADFLAIKSKDNDEILNKLGEFFSGQEDAAKEGLADLSFIVRALREVGVSEEHWKIDLSVARGLDYYTGTVFETVLLDKPEFGSVFSGGRYNGLTNRFISGSNVPAIGASVGLSRLMVAMEELGLLPQKDSVTEVLVTIFSPEQELISAKIAKQIREAGFNVEVYYGDDRTLRGQFSYAAKRSIPFAVVIGPDEAAQNKLQLKNMEKREQEIISLEDCIVKLKEVLR